MNRGERSKKRGGRINVREAAAQWDIGQGETSERKKVTSVGGGGSLSASTPICGGLTYVTCFNLVSFWCKRYDVIHLFIHSILLSFSRKVGSIDLQ